MPSKEFTFEERVRAFYRAGGMTSYTHTCGDLPFFVPCDACDEIQQRLEQKANPAQPEHSPA